METIAEAARCQGTLYKHYQAKESLIQHRIDQICLERQESIAAAVIAMPASVKRFEYLFREIEPYLESMRSYVFPYLLFMCSPNNGWRAPTIFDTSLVELLRFGAGHRRHRDRDACRADGGVLDLFALGIPDALG